MNKLQRLNKILLEEEQAALQNAVVRIFLECLYGTVGYIPPWEHELEEEPKKARKFNATKARLELVEAHVEEIGISETDIVVGEKSC